MASTDYSLNVARERSPTVHIAMGEFSHTIEEMQKSVSLLYQYPSTYILFTSFAFHESQRNYVVGSSQPEKVPLGFLSNYYYHSYTPPSTNVFMTVSPPLGRRIQRWRWCVPMFSQLYCTLPLSVVITIFPSTQCPPARLPLNSLRGASSDGAAAGEKAAT